jgi:hypothetical protein
MSFSIVETEMAVSSFSAHFSAKNSRDGKGLCLLVRQLSIIL